MAVAIPHRLAQHIHIGKFFIRHTPLQPTHASVRFLPTLSLTLFHIVHSAVRIRVLPHTLGTSQASNYRRCEVRQCVMWGTSNYSQTASFRNVDSTWLYSGIWNMIPFWGRRKGRLPGVWLPGVSFLMTRVYIVVRIRKGGWRFELF